MPLMKNAQFLPISLKLLGIDRTMESTPEGLNKIFPKIVDFLFIASKVAIPKWVAQVCSS